MEKLQRENEKMRLDLKKFAEKIDTSKLNEKIAYYVNNREKILEADDRRKRPELSKMAVSCVIQLYDALAGKKVKDPELTHFLLDSLFAMKIICELDGFVRPEVTVNLNDYENYQISGDLLCRVADQLYIRYLKDDVMNML
jgi:hypothetical protein